MQKLFLDVIAAAARSVILDPSELRHSSYATWLWTREESDFDSNDVTTYLRREGCGVNESLIQKYGELNREAVDLREIGSAAPWLECLRVPFINYGSFEQFRVAPKYDAIFTFTTPAINDSGDAAFLEVWEEDGRYSNMGTWSYIQMCLVDGKWKASWKQMHTIS